MKFIVLLIFISCSFLLGQDFLYAQADWYQPEIHSQLYQSFNQDPVQPYMQIPDLDETHTHFALSSFKIAESSIKRYLSQNDHQGIMLSYKTYDPNQFLLIKVLGGFDYQQNEDNSYFFINKGLKLQAQMTNNISMSGYWWAGQFRGDKQYYLTSPLIDGFIQPDDNVTYLDNLQGAIKYNRYHFQMALGRGKYQVGNNISGSIILDNAVNDYGYFSSTMVFGTLTLSYLHAALTPDQNEVVHYQNTGVNSVDSSRVDKFLVLHKLDWDPSRHFNGFIGEEIIYGNRSLDLNYLMPHVFWRIIEHNLEDRDNVLIFGGMNWKVNHNLTIYENTLLDEFSQSKILTDWWGSKYALQTGVSLRFKNPLSDERERIPRITLEMTAVRPWTYTHFIKWNKFSEDNIALGYPVGSNCLNYSTELDFPFTDRLLFGFNASYSRQGSIGNRFDLNTNNPEVIPDIENTKTKWLAGTITDTKAMKVMVEWKPLAHHFLRLGTILKQIDETDWTKELTFSYRTEF